MTRFEDWIKRYERLPKTRDSNRMLLMAARLRRKVYYINLNAQAYPYRRIQYWEKSDFYTCIVGSYMSDYNVKIETPHRLPKWRDPCACPKGKCLNVGK